MTDAPRMTENSLLNSFASTGFRLLGHIVAGMLVAALLIVWVPRYFVIFENYDLALPDATIQTLNISELVVNYWYLLGFVALVFDAVVMFALSRLPAKARWLAGAWSGAVLLCVILFLCFVFMALSIPLESLPAPAVAETK